MEIFLGVIFPILGVVFLFWLFKPEKKSVYPDRPAVYYTSRKPVTSIKTPSPNPDSGSQPSYSSSGVSDFSGVYDAGSHYDSGCGGDSGGGGDCGGGGGGD